MQMTVYSQFRLKSSKRDMKSYVLAFFPYLTSQLKGARPTHSHRWNNFESP